MEKQKSKKENKQEKYLELQMLSSQYSKIQQQIGVVQQQMLELSSLTLNLEDLQKVQQDTQVLVPFGAGILLFATINEPKNLLVNVGSNTVVQKDIEEAKDLIKKQVLELEKINKGYQEELSKLSVSLQILQQELT